MEIFFQSIFLIEYANRVCRVNYLEIAKSDIVSFDYFRAHKRKSHQCFGALINRRIK